MPSWNELLDQINTPLDKIRREYLGKLYQKTGRNVVAYYSGWLQRPPDTSGLGVCDADMNSFMSVFHGLDKNKGLDLILHTPGGEVPATEAIVSYFHSMFGTNIRCFVPQLAMSAGTMIACGCKEIVMGKQSSLGPFDPQLRGVPAYGLLAEFNQAALEIKNNPEKIPLWQVIVSKYHPTFITECQNAIFMSSEIVEKWLENVMFVNEHDAEKKARKIVDKLNNHKDTKNHARHINYKTALSYGLKIKQLEDDNELQDIVLTLHHAYIELFNQTKINKIIENQKGVGICIRSL